MTYLLAVAVGATAGHYATKLYQWLNGPAPWFVDATR